MKKTVLEFRKVDIFYEKNKVVLQDVNLKISQGEMVVILGPNGSGKTSLIKTIHKINKYKGSIKLNNENIKYLKTKKIAQNVAYINQIQEGFEDVKVIDFIKMSRIPHKKIWEKINSEDLMLIEKLLDHFHLHHLKDKYMNDISGGQRQIIGIIAGIAQETDVLLIDEPTNHLDPKIVLEVFGMIKNLKRKNKTIILISHNINLAAKLSDKLILIKDHKIFKQGKTKDILQKSNIDKLFDVSSKVSKGSIVDMELK